MSWQPIETAPRDGTPFLAKDGDCIFSAFYMKNPNYNAVQTETLKVMMRPGRYSAAGNWFVPTQWMLVPPDG